eukprot:scaffold21912_cov127-Isochrysis_galbana.AAC.4
MRGELLTVSEGGWRYGDPFFSFLLGPGWSCSRWALSRMRPHSQTSPLTLKLTLMTFTTTVKTISSVVRGIRTTRSCCLCTDRSHSPRPPRAGVAAGGCPAGDIDQPEGVRSDAPSGRLPVPELSRARESCAP